MKSTIKLLAFLVAASGVSSAASIVVTNLVDRDFRTPAPQEDIALNATYTAKIGFLSNESVLTSSVTFDQINAAWVNAGNIAFASGDAAGYAGYFSGKATFTDAAGLAGKDVYVWVTNGAGLNAVLKSLTVDFLADGAIPNENSATIEANGFATNWQLLLGEVNTSGANGGALGGSIVLNGVPEPSALLLGGLGLLGLVRRRRN